MLGSLCSRLKFLGILPYLFQGNDGPLFGSWRGNFFLSGFDLNWFNPWGIILLRLPLSVTELETLPNSRVPGCLTMFQAFQGSDLPISSERQAVARQPDTWFLSFEAVP